MMKYFSAQNKEKKIASRPDAGFSLIEMMVAILIIGATFIGLIHAFPYSLSLINSGKNETIASYLAQEKIEEIFRTGYDNIGAGVIEPKHRLGAVDSYLYHFQRETEIRLIDGNFDDSGSDVGLKLASTTVFYTDAISKREKTYGLKTVISDK